MKAGLSFILLSYISVVDPVPFSSVLPDTEILAQH